MKKTFLYIFFIIVFINPAQAQKKTFIYPGVSLFGGSDKNSSNITVLPSITVFPGFKITQSKNFAILAGIPFSVGFSYDNNDGDWYAGIDLPVTLNFCFGSAFNELSSKKFGFFIGGGAGYHVCHNESYYSDGSIDKEHLRMTGILLQTGATIIYDKKEGQGIVLRLSWLGEYPDHAKNVFGIGLIALLGSNKN